VAQEARHRAVSGGTHILKPGRVLFREADYFLGKVHKYTLR